jgi:hypothetical protein
MYKGCIEKMWFSGFLTIVTSHISKHTTAAIYSNSTILTSATYSTMYRSQHPLNQYGLTSSVSYNKKRSSRLQKLQLLSRSSSTYKMCHPFSKSHSSHSTSAKHTLLQEHIGEHEVSRT